MAGRTNIVYIPFSAENIFTPNLFAEKIDLIYLCMPNNPTGTAFTIDELKKWVDYARAGYEIFGGVNSPYIWFKVPKPYTSWEYFNLLLDKVNVGTTPGSGFGTVGEGCFRLSSFGSYEDTVEAINRIKEFKKQ